VRADRRQRGQHSFTSATTIWDALEDAGMPTDGREMVEEPARMTD
jgi:hypothetical protein